MSFGEPLSFFQRSPDRSVVVGADTDTVQLGSIDGEAVRELLIRFWIENVSASSVDVKLYPNGSAPSAGTGATKQVGTSLSNAARSELCPIFTIGLEFFSGYWRLQTRLNPLGSSFNFNRRFEGFTTIGNASVAAASSGFIRANGWWEYGDGALTSLDVVMTLAGTSTLEAGIGQGSVFQLYSLERE